MKQRWSRLAVLLLITVVAVSSLAGCSRQAESREAPAAEPTATEAADLQPGEQAEPTEQAEQAEPVEGMDTPRPGETVVSVMTAAPEGATPEAGATLTEPTVEAGVTEVVEATTEPAPTAEATAAGQYIVHRVKKGETLSVIAARYGTTVRAIKRANSLESNTIYTGQKLNIPTP